MNYYQEYRLDGTLRFFKKSLPSLLHKVVETLDRVPKGLIGVDVETGLVEVELSKGKVANMKLGKLLMKDGFTDEEARSTSGNLRSELLLYKGAKLSFTDSSEEAFRVYENGPGSCMAGEDCVQAYHSDNVSVAYVDIGGRIIARSVVCTDEDIGLTYADIYGNAEIMRPLLVSAGYSKGSLEGCTLARLEHDDGRVMVPYLDCGTKLNDCGTHLEITGDGKYGTQETNGEWREYKCEECHADSDEDSLQFSDYYDEYHCEVCFEKYHIQYESEWYAVDSDKVTMVGEDHYHVNECVWSDEYGEYLLTEDAKQSPYNDEYYKEEDIVCAITELDQDQGVDCYDGHCTKASDGNWVHDNLLEIYGEHIKPQKED